ncbi:MAG: hypothetical protein P4L69_19190 [Desulfosporosinus sp.]|nr:hypothetical protein [Desulfosporosinus sp.]
MLLNKIKSKQDVYRENAIKLMVIILCLVLLGADSHWERMSSLERFQSSQTAVPLLLNSGVVMTKKAEVNVILWSENGDIPDEISKNKPLSDWTWNYKKLRTGNGKLAVTLSGHRQIDKNEERNLYTWYTIMAQQLSKTDDRIYLDERVPQVMDISAYLSQTNSTPLQWSMTGSLISIAAYQNKRKMGVKAGNDRVNIQLLSRGKNSEGQTVLAMPVLLEEF